MKPIEIRRKSEDGLSATVYAFVFFDDRMAVVLDAVFEETRQTKRHGWKRKPVYLRIPDRDFKSVPEPQIPDDVKNEGVNFIRFNISFKTWKEYRGR